MTLPCVRGRLSRCRLTCSVKGCDGGSRETVAHDSHAPRCHVRRSVGACLPRDSGFAASTGFLSPRTSVLCPLTMSLICSVNTFLSLKRTDNAVPGKTEIPVWSEAEGAVGDRPVPSALAVLRRGAHPPALSGRRESEGHVPEGKAQGRPRGHNGHKVSTGPAATLPVGGLEQRAPPHRASCQLPQRAVKGEVRGCGGPFARSGSSC